MKSLFAFAVTGLALAGSAQAADFTLTFDQGAACATNCGNGSTIMQTYGDVAGIVDVNYIDVNSPTTGLVWWDTDYNDLQGVIWAGGGDANSHARIEIMSLNGEAVKLNSMDFGAWVSTTRGTNIVVTAAGGGPVLFSYFGNVGSAVNHSSFAPNVSAANGLWIDWSNSAFNVGIDNVNFSVAAVPEPETYAMFLAGLGLLGFVARRRKP